MQGWLVCCCDCLLGFSVGRGIVAAIFDPDFSRFCYFARYFAKSLSIKKKKKMR